MVIMIPDYQGKALTGSFVKKLRANFGDAIIIPVINGLPSDEMHNLTQTAHSRVELVVSQGNGLLNALLAGYKHCIEHYPEKTLVRMDTAKHPIREIQKLIESASRIIGMVIGDLVFDETTLPPHTPEE